VKAKVRASVDKFYKAIRSDDAKLRIKAVDDLAPTEELIKTLFGDDARFLWPKQQQYTAQLREVTDKFKARLDMETVAIEFVNMRSDEADTHGVTKRAIARLPADVPIFEMHLYAEKGESDNQWFPFGPFVLVDGKLYFCDILYGLQNLSEQTNGTAPADEDDDAASVDSADAVDAGEE
jgi:hypothetical protein